ncbi:hypothetical protein GPALN_016356 [Globodera pallida]|nr:hypothetical protein GPALN_016356 [Globodera pallida]
MEMESPKALNDIDGIEEEQYYSNDDQQFSDVPNDGQPQITITVLTDGGVKVTDVGGSDYIVDKEALAIANLDINDLNQEAVNTLLEMTLHDEGSHISATPENNNSTVKPTEDHQVTKSKKKKTRDAAPQRKRRLEESDQPTSSVGPKEQLSTSILMRFAGATCYKPVQVSNNQRKGRDISKTVPNFCCAVCNKSIPKTTTDFILLRLPAHARCAKSTMMVVSDDEESVE